MAAYKIVFHNEDGAPIAESSVEQPDDAAAVAHASHHSHPHILQVWRGEALIASVPPRSERALLLVAQGRRR
ncbi:MAG TPA: hypothetical protein VHS81_12120 [Caulobacteraceae bacterium]|nr:hypothetical protein [Caulobacteraceae bacterium]